MKTAIAAIIVFLWALGSTGAVSPSDSCITCHASLEGKTGEPARLFATDVHRQAGLGCADCHGGNPNDDSMDAMNRAKGFRGTPKKTQVPAFCGRCHADITYMHRFNPKARADQLSQYLTSVHGKRLARGDTKVATCVDCHGVHNILPPSDTRAPVYPMQVASTCGRCHADATYMKDYKIPTDQIALYGKSVHAQMLAAGDTSAPTCTTCHGNHGATPPGVSSVANVCGTCHVFFTQLFEKSPHQAAFARQDLPGCVACHSNHEILKPTDDWVGVSANAVCTNCHVAGTNGYRVAEKMAGDIARLRTFAGEAEEILSTAERSGMEVSSAKVELAGAHEALIKARVDVHTFRAEEVQKQTDEGVEIAKKAHAAGIAALRERDFRRKGLGVALIAIVLAISGLYLKIRQIEACKEPRPPVDKAGP
jgi:hypothetical protein